MNLIFLFFFGFQAHGAPPVIIPKCVRPEDFANSKFVASYEACLKRQRDFCQGHRDDKGCEALVDKKRRPYFKTTVDDIDPTKRCGIQKGGTYRCLQDPVRFMTAVAKEPGEQGPVGVPSTSTVPIEESPGAEGSPTAAPSAPPIPVMPRPKPK